MREAPDPRGRNDLLLALAGTGHGDEALALADSLLAMRDTTFAWDSVVVALGRQDPRMASALVGRLQGDPKLTPELRARRLYEDALRLASVDSAVRQGPPARRRRGCRRPARAASAPASSSCACSSGRRGRSTTSPRPATRSPRWPGRASGAAAEAGLLEGTVARLRQLPDSAAPVVPRGDLRLFLGAEAARDTVGSPAARRGPLPPPGGRLAGLALRTEGVAGGRAPRSHRDRRSRARLDSLYATARTSPSRGARTRPPIRRSRTRSQTYAAAQLQAAARPQPGAPRGDQGQPLPGQPQRRRATPSRTGKNAPGGGGARSVTRRPRADLSRTVFGRHFQNPLLLAAGTAGFGRELAGVMDLDRLGGIVTKAVSLAPRRGQSRAPGGRVPGRHAQLGRARQSGARRVCGPSCSRGWPRTLRRAQVLVNVVGFTVEEYAEVVGGLDGASGHRRRSSSTCRVPTPAPAASSSAPTRNASGGSSRGCRARTRLPLVGQAVAGPARHPGHGARGARRRRRRDLGGEHLARPPLRRRSGAATGWAMATAG